MNIKAIVILLMLSISLAQAATYKIEYLPSLYCPPDEIKKLIKQNLAIDVEDITIVDRAGHVDYLHIFVKQSDKAKQKQIEDVVDKYCMHRIEQSQAPLQRNDWLVYIDNQTNQRLLVFTRYSDWLATEVEGDLLQADLPSKNKPFKRGDNSLSAVLSKQDSQFLAFKLWFNRYPDSKGFGMMILQFYTPPKTQVCKMGILSETNGLSTRIVSVLSNNTRCQATWDSQWYSNQQKITKQPQIQIQITNNKFVQ